ncbi:tetratricopeptide repeat-containing diguanylate cyclase [Lysobacter olei]
MELQIGCRPKGMIRACAACFLLAAILSFPGVGFASGNIDALLARAEGARNVDAKEFQDTLAQLRSIREKATATQADHIDLLGAYGCILEGDHAKAIKVASQLFKGARDVNIRFRAGLLVTNSAAAIRDFPLGLRYLTTTLALDAGNVEPNLRQTALGVSALLHNQLGQYSLGKHYAERLLLQRSTPRNRCVAKQLRLEALYGLGSWAKSDDEVDEAIADCDAQGEAIASNLLRGYLARHFVSLGQVSRAVELLESHLPEVEETRYPYLIGEINGLLAEYKLMMGDPDAADRHAQAVLERGEKDVHSLPVVTAHRVQYETALKRGDIAIALGEYRKYAEADKARLDEIKAREFAFQLSRHELQQKNQAIELLEKQNEVLTLQQQVSQASVQNSRLLLTLLGLVITAIALWAYKVKRVQVAFRRQAEVDGLTGISNRSHFRENAEALLQKCAGAGREASLVLLDLDYFKQINDTHGHAVGDWVLQQVAVACKAACREGDVCGRLGGEEFGILSCGSDMDAARRIAQRVRENLAAIDTTVIGQPVTASFGLTTSGRSGHAFEAMFTHADAAMYQAKAGGRDRVRAFGEDGVASATVLELVRG